MGWVGCCEEAETQPGSEEDCMTMAVCCHLKKTASNKWCWSNRIFTHVIMTPELFLILCYSLLQMGQRAEALKVMGGSRDTDVKISTQASTC